MPGEPGHTDTFLLARSRTLIPSEVSRNGVVTEVDGCPVRRPGGRTSRFTFRSELLGNAAIDRDAVDFLEIRKDHPFSVGRPFRHPCWNVCQREPFAAIKPAAP